MFPLSSLRCAETCCQGNNTLEDSLCPDAGDASVQLLEWLETFAPPITSRLNAGAPGANLTDTDIFSLLSLCPFESVFLENESPFCGIFSGDHVSFPGLEYIGDLDKYYGTG